MNTSALLPTRRHSVSVVIPVYAGELTLDAVVGELVGYMDESTTPHGTTFQIVEIILVDDNGPGRSDQVMRDLAEKYPIVRAVWLSRNFGQHAATLAGIASSSGDWIVTMDEDSQHDPADIAVMLDTALAKGAQVVYARPVNPPPHGRFRNAASRGAKRVANRLLGTLYATDYNSYRLLLGSIGRGVAAYSGSGVYLDVAIGWVAGRYATAPTTLRGEQRASGYSLRRLLGHFLRLVITSGTRGLRVVSWIGVAFAAVGVVIAIWVLVEKLTSGSDVQGWASTIIVLLVTAGAILFSLGVIAEYIGVNVNMAMGKPAYLITSDPQDGPLGRRPRKTE
jgi:polyisoprenyl-phosphate glycosyltransferase